MLCIGKNDLLFNYEELKTVPTPQATSSWQPVSHYKFAEMVKESLSDHSINIREEQHGVSKDGQRYFGLLAVSGSSFERSDYETMVGLRNSHDQRFSIGLAWGARILVCSNLSFMGEVVIRRRHTRLILKDLPCRIRAAVTQITSLEAEQETRFDLYRQTDLERYGSDVNDMLILGFDSRVISSSQIGLILNKWRQTENQDKGTVWEFFNTHTSILQDRVSTESLVGKTTALQKLVLDPYCFRKEIEFQN